MEKPYLKECPFCASYEIDILYGRDGYVSNSYMPNYSASVKCMKCGCGTRKYQHAETAVRKWNRRGGEPV